jgi:hypothetical protein
MTHTLESLEGLTAKALRPIAADLGVTGASRMKKAEIITAIVAKETERAELSAIVEGIPADLEASREEERVRDLRLKYTDAELIAADDASLREQYEGTPARFNPEVIDEVHALALKVNADVDNMSGCHVTEGCTRVAQHGGECRVVIDGDERNREANESADEVFAEIAAENLTQTPVLAPKFAAGDRFRIEPCEGVWSVVELIDLDPSGGPGYAWTTEIVEDAKHSDLVIGKSLTLTEDFLQNDYVTKVEPAPAEEYFARMTRRGTETVAVQRVACGRVHFRFIDAKSGRRSAPYDMRETTFRAQYVKVPS